MHEDPRLGKQEAKRRAAEPGSLCEKHHERPGWHAVTCGKAWSWGVGRVQRAVYPGPQVLAGETVLSSIWALPQRRGLQGTQLRCPHRGRGLQSRPRLEKPDGGHVTQAPLSRQEEVSWAPGQAYGTQEGCWYWCQRPGDGQAGWAWAWFPAWGVPCPPCRSLAMAWKGRCRSWSCVSGWPCSRRPRGARRRRSETRSSRASAPRAGRCRTRWSRSRCAAQPWGGLQP